MNTAKHDTSVSFSFGSSIEPRDVRARTGGNSDLLGHFSKCHQMLRSNSIDIGQALVLTLLIAVTAIPASAAPPSFMGLGGLPGVTISLRSQAHDVSDDGSVIVGDAYTASQGNEAFRWTQADGMVSLGLIPGASYSFGYGVSGDGSVVVGRSEGGSPTTTFRWTQAGGMVGLTDPIGGGEFSDAYGVSGDGSRVVGYGFPPNLHRISAYRWTQGGNVDWLGFLPGSNSSDANIANGISANGSVVVGHGYVSSVGQAFRWTQAGGMVGLGDLPGGTSDSKAFSASEDGSVVVGYGNNALGGEAFRWTQAGGMVGLGVLPLGNHSSIASDVSADGSVIVGASDSETGFQDFIWDAQHGMRSLRDVLVNDLGLDLSGWTLSSYAYGARPHSAISADGLTIVGTGFHLFEGGFSGTTEAYVAHIPEPATLALLGLASLLMIRHRRSINFGAMRQRRRVGQTREL